MFLITKTIRTFLILVSMCIMMTSCVWDPPSYHFDYDEMIETVVSIELVKYDNNDTVSVIVKPDTKLKFDLNKIISSQVLEESKTNVFFIRPI